MDPQLVIFAIQAGVKLGQKVYDVLLDETVEGPLLLPVANLFGDVQESMAANFFFKKENRHLVEEGGPYFGFDSKKLLLAYKTLRVVGEQAEGSFGQPEDAVTIIGQLNAFELVKKEFASKPAWQRILGTVVEIGIDYFAANPQALGKDSSAKRVVTAFLSALDETDFAEGSRTEIVGDLLGAALRTFEANVTLIDDDKRVQVLLGGIARSLVAEVDSATSEGAKVRREDLFRRIGSSLLRGGIGAFTENIDLFVPKDTTLKTLVESTLSQVLAGIKDQEDLFTNQSIELVFKSALGAVGENAALFTDRKILQELISHTVTALTDTQGRKLFSDDTVSAVLREALEVVRENVETLIDPDNPQQQLLANAVAAVARSLASSLAGGGRVRDLLSNRQLTELSRVVFEEVARHPEQLLGGNLDEDKKTALAQIIGSVARALGDDPTRFVNGAGFIELVRLALQVAVRNADKLVDLNSADTSTNLLFKVLQQLTEALLEQGDPRKIVTREVFLDITRRLLPVVSANVEVLTAGKKDAVGRTVVEALVLASGILSGRVNGDNLPVLIQQLLLAVLWDELNLDEKTAVELAARRILKAA